MPKIPEKRAIHKRTDALDPKKYIQMLSCCQSTLPHLLQNKNISLQEFSLQIREYFPKYSAKEVSSLLKQWLVTPIFIGDILNQEKNSDE